MSKKYIYFLFVILSVLGAAVRVAAQHNLSSDNISESQEKVAAILDQWTVFHWGQDCIAWLVHYPEELVEPYIHLEALRRKLKSEDVEKYRKAFKEELRMGTASAFMLSVHVFGPEPIQLSPVSDKIFLIDSTGKGHKPISYEKKLDIPIKGLIQGFVFFKRQDSSVIKVMLRGLIPGKSTSFVFKRQGVWLEKNVETIDRNLKEHRKNVEKSKNNPENSEILIKIPIITKPENLKKQEHLNVSKDNHFEK